MIFKKKREFSIFLYFILVIIASSIVLSESYNTSKPIIEVIYGEIPVTILEYNLSDKYAGSWRIYPITNPLYGLSAYNFSVYYLDNGNYTFYILAEDLDGNTVEAYKNFEISHDGMNVWLISPIPAVGKTRNFNITVGTQYNATCKWGNTAGDTCDAPCRFDSMPRFFDVTGNKTIHKIFYTAPDTDMELFVFCRNDLPEANLSNPSNYGGTHFMTGYDTNRPSITYYAANPNPVIDWNYKKTEVKVITNEPTVCYIQGGNSSVSNGIIGRYFPGEDPLLYESYKTEHLLNISYNVYDPTPYNFRYNISCRDHAGWSDEKFLNVLVNLTGTLIITQMNPEFSSSLNILYEIKTSINTVNCSLKLNNGTLQFMNQNNPRNYTLNINLLLGINNISVTCIAYPDTKTENFRITADNEPPILEILMHTSTCSLNEINFILNASDRGTGIDYFNYSIWKNDLIVKNWTKTTSTHITYTGNLIDGENYTVKAFAVDKAALKSDTKEKTITVHNNSFIGCDLTNPTANITYVGDQYQKNVTVTCRDNTGGSGCTSSFDYVLKDINSNCDNASYSNIMLYSNLPLTVTQDSLLCVRVADKAENFGYASKAIPISMVVCGNNIAEPGINGNPIEECDGTDLRGFTCNDFNYNGGILLCTPPDGSSEECKFDRTNCQLGNNGYCGDNITNNFPNEQCDGTLEHGDWGNITSCRDFNFTGGTLKCNPYTAPLGQRCMFNTSSCYKTPTNPTPRCDGALGSLATLLDPGEQCEPFLFQNFGIPNLKCSNFDNFRSGNVTCKNNCILDISNCNAPEPEPYCGDGIVQTGEVCDPPGRKYSCDSLDDGRYTGGNVTCGNNCQWVNFTCQLVPECGNGIREGDEHCDGTDLGGTKCTDIGNNIGGNLSCFPKGHPLECKFNTINCDRGYGYCGDGLINNPFNEQCDGNSWGRISKEPDVGCRQFGFSGGTLRCYSPFSPNQCKFDTTGCIDNSPLNTCGDSILQSGEQCERDRSFSLKCSNFDSFTEGNLFCDYGSCFFNIRDCKVADSFCGNNIVEIGETCDGNNFGNLTKCSDIRPTLNGSLVCLPPGHNNECQIDINACTLINDTVINSTGYCGDGIRNNNEVCDSGTNGLTCIDVGYSGGNLRCINCNFNTDECFGEQDNGYCGDGVLNSNNNESCEPGLPLTVTCIDLGFIGGNLSCNPRGHPKQCTFNINNCIAPVNLGFCGDGYILPNNESCDLNNLGGADCTAFDDFIGGKLLCGPPNTTNACYWDTSNCDVGYGYCGDKIINNFPNEQCDGTLEEGDWGNITSCRDFGFTGGTLKCYPPNSPNRCNFDTTECQAIINDGYCGDTVLNKGEQCERNKAFTLSCTDFDKFIGGNIGCDYTTCKYNLDNCILPVESVCGDGLISGTELCDGLNFGGSALCLRFDDFINGSLKCFPPGHRFECMYDFSGCVEIPEQPVCGNNKIEDTEECDGRRNFFKCTDFNLTGQISCTNCKVNTSTCDGRAQPVIQQCGNSILEPPEACDGSVTGLSNSSFSSLYNCQYGIICSENCNIECAPGVLSNTCNNLIKDNDETGIDCGGLCSPCPEGQGCKEDSDCESRICINNICREDPCTNSVIDDGETDVDCGGSCSPCSSGKNCIVDDDCQSGKCVNGVCSGEEIIDEKEKPNTVGVILIIVGSILILGGTGYVVYKEYFEKKKTPEPIRNVQIPIQQPQKVIDPKVLELQKKKLEEKRQKQQEERKSLLEGFDKESEEKDDVKKLKERPVNKELLKEAGYVDLTEKKDETKKTEGVFKDLEKIVGGENDEKIETVTEPNKELKTEEINTETKDSFSGKEKKSKIIKLRKKPEVFNKLEEISGKKSSTEKDLNKISNKILSKNMDREDILSEDFTNNIKRLIENNNIDGQKLKEFLFENISNGKIKKSEAAKILHELGLL